MKKSTNIKRDIVLSILLAAAFCALLAYYQFDKKTSHSYAISILERSAIYAVVALSMNLRNGLTRLF